MRLAAALSAALLAAACGGGAEGAGGGGRHITVFAASSLTDAFGELGDLFGRRERVEVAFNFLASSELAAQLEQGAAADVFASADEASMARVEEAGLVSEGPRVFAHNRLAIVVRPGNPEGVEDLSDLEEDRLVVALCAPACPAGHYAREALERAGVSVRPDSLETEVRAVVTRVASGEADAGIAYVTAAGAARGVVEAVAIPASDDVVADYPIAVLQGARAEARSFVELVVSPEGQRVLRRHGFLPA